MEQQFGKVISVEEIGMGTRVCLDFADLLGEQEGLLVGNTGSGYVLVLAETRTTDTYPARPFRVNCGAVHQYLNVGEQTLYLSEVKPGMRMEINSPTGKRSAAVGRVKMELRSLIRIEIEIQGKMISVTLQSSDSVQLCGEGLIACDVTKLQPGDIVLCKVDEPGRHLGNRIEEIINEY